MDTIACIQGFDRRVIPMSEGYELHNKIYNIGDNALLKWVGNTAHILAYLFNSTSRQCHEVWASQLPFLNNLKDTFLPNEACFITAVTGLGIRLSKIFPWLVSAFNVP